MKIRDRNAAYGVLGLEPGADRAAVEEAYRRLIKLHHPDRSGGDASRAAELNHAYFELRRRQEQPEYEPSPAAFVMPADRPRTYTRRRRSGLWPVMAVALGALLVMNWEPITGQGQRWVDRLAELQAGPARGQGSAVRIDPWAIEGPLNERAVGESILRATRLAELGDWGAMAAHSRDCHRRMRLRPELAELDRCAAFDDSAAVLADHDRLADPGIFSAPRVTARQLTAASLLSSDYLAIERRLDRVRTMVQLALRPRLPPLPPPRRVEEVEPPADPALVNAI